MFPYPSAQGLHVGHPEGYTATDIVARMKRMQGFNVLHPMGWDALAYPPSNSRFKNNRHPEEFTRANIAHFKNQIQSLGFSYDWSKELATIDPKYYKWTQWIFLQMYKHDFAYVADVPVNYCPDLGTVLANEEVIDGKSERGGFPVIRMPMRQWILKITAYAAPRKRPRFPRLAEVDLGDAAELDRRIGRASKSPFKLAVLKESFQVFTTRVDTLFGCTYCCLAPEHPFVKKYVSKARRPKSKPMSRKPRPRADLLADFLRKRKDRRLPRRRCDQSDQWQAIPVYVADYVLGSYGSGPSWRFLATMNAIMPLRKSTISR
jgi:leucyl-tRNA synthetase